MSDSVYLQFISRHCFSHFKVSSQKTVRLDESNELSWQKVSSMSSSDGIFSTNLLKSYSIQPSTQRASQR